MMTGGSQPSEKKSKEKEKKGAALLGRLELAGPGGA
jgi:hypothetical protein